MVLQGLVLEFWVVIIAYRNIAVDSCKRTAVTVQHAIPQGEGIRTFLCRGGCRLLLLLWMPGACICLPVFARGGQTRFGGQTC